MVDKEIALKYANRKKRRKRVAIISLVCTLAVTTFIIIAFSIFATDRFTITTNNEQGLCLTLDQETFTTKLTAPPLLSATDTQYTDVVEELDETPGSTSTNHYFAYSFYLGGQGNEESINYNLTMSLTKYSNSIEEAIRVMVIRNGHKEIYAKADENGNAKSIYYGENHLEEPEKIGETKPFRTNKNIIVEAYEIIPGNFDKYTIVI